jgi:hypothetical protein
MSNAVVALPPIPKTAEGLRDALFDELNALRAGKSNPQHARAVANLSRQVIESIRVQVQAQRLLKEMGKQKPALLGARK